MKPVIIITFLFTLFSIKSYSCDCVYAGPFIKMAKTTPLVVQVKIKHHLSYKNINASQMPTAMEVEIIKIFKGKEIRKTIMVWGDDGNLCRPYLDTFKRGDYYMLALRSSRNSRRQQQEKDTDYFVDGCGCYWLFVDAKKQVATGDIDGEKRSIKLSVLNNLLR